ncbi:MAG TPA: type II toxin-antitoxin system Phd/YefM family antitoxin [Candidatus Andersenbacteria bacterium]|nr:type II toxin-antitoxin system Phd/YefM family antitoxin [Candidatus Andersenbacteria bacterium]
MKHKKRIVTATEARKNLYALIRQANKPGERVTITLAGEEPVVLMPQEEMEGWMETLEVMSDPQLVKDIEAAKKEKDFIPLEEVQRELGLDQD